MTGPGNRQIQSSGGTDNMATIKITTIKCVRPQDVVRYDEPRLYIAGLLVWDDKMKKGDIVQPNVSRTFSNSVLVELKEQNNNKSEKSLGKWTIDDTATAVGNP